MKLPLVTFVLCVLLSSGSSQSQDRFLGTWKLNKDKSARSHYFPEEMFTIERQGNTYKFTYSSPDHKRTEQRWWFVTDMKGAWVEIEPNGMNRLSPVRVIRKDSDEFEENNELFTKDCKVSVDGKAMIVRRELFVDDEPSERVFVFDRVH